MCQPQEKISRAPGSARSRTAWRGAGRVAVDAPGDEHGQDPVTARDRAPDHLPIVRAARHDPDAIGEIVQLPDALLAAHTDDLVAARQPCVTM